MLARRGSLPEDLSKEETNKEKDTRQDVSMDTVGCVCLDVDYNLQLGTSDMRSDIVAATSLEYEEDLEKTQEGFEWKPDLKPEKDVYGTKSGLLLDPDKVALGRRRELGLMQEHNMYDVVKNEDAKGGSHVHAKWLQDVKGEEVRCRLVATQLAIGERLDVTQSTPPLMIARMLLSFALRHTSTRATSTIGSSAFVTCRLRSIMPR